MTVNDSWASEKFAGRVGLAPQPTRLPLQFVSAQHSQHRALLDFLRRLRIKNAIENPMSRTLFRISLPVVSIGLLFLVTGCGEDPRFSAKTQYLGGVYGNAEGGPPHDTVSYWDGDNSSGSPSVKISLGEQRAYFYKGGVLVGVSQLSTGREGLNTPLGNFKITQKDKDHVSSLFGDYVDSAGTVVVPNVDIKKDPKPPGAHFRGTPMPYFMRIVSGTGMHAGYLPGYPASHGCIRMPEFMAENFFKSVSVGTPVAITN
jgi:L,D-transpeptidase-like protein